MHKVRVTCWIGSLIDNSTVLHYAPSEVREDCMMNNSIIPYDTIALLLHRASQTDGQIQSPTMEAVEMKYPPKIKAKPAGQTVMS